MMNVVVTALVMATCASFHFQWTRREVIQKGNVGATNMPCMTSRTIHLVNNALTKTMLTNATDIVIVTHAVTLGSRMSLLMMILKVNLIDALSMITGINTWTRLIHMDMNAQPMLVDSVKVTATLDFTHANGHGQSSIHCKRTQWTLHVDVTRHGWQWSGTHGGR